MAVGLGLLRLPPRHFWSMTPREFASAVLGAPDIRHIHGGVPTRAEFVELSARFPD